MKVSFRHALLLGLIMISVSNTVSGQPRNAPKATEIEIAQMPPFCQARLRLDRAQMQLWSERLGKEHTLHLHHYCNGILYFNRASTSSNEKSRRDYLNGAVRQMDYVLKRWPSEFPLYNQAATYKQQAEMLRSFQ